MPTAPARTTCTVNNRGSGTGGSRRSSQPAQAISGSTAVGTARLSARLAALEARTTGSPPSPTQRFRGSRLIHLLGIRFGTGTTTPATPSA
ncbi:hypothetical protein ABZ760_17480 [Streptomyces sp. NPDC006658]|uniref:hypothetical protein n=1 Tax=Streptomyces sp. NPDC006658 TaxID=3156900 RepID=UPI0033C1C26B